MAKEFDLKDIVQYAIDTSIQQISGYDASFLYAETPTSPMHIATSNIVEDSLKYEDFKEILASKVHMLPKFRQRLLNVPMNLDYPYWVDDPNFDIDLHLNRIKLPDPSNWRTLRDRTSSLFTAPLVLRRLLWSVHFIEGLDENEQVPKGSVDIVTKVHHVMIDGQFGEGIMSVLYANDQDSKGKKHLKPKPWDPEPLPDELSLLLKSGYGFMKNPFKIPKTVAETVFAIVKNKASKTLSIQKDLIKRLAIWEPDLLDWK